MSGRSSTSRRTSRLNHWLSTTLRRLLPSRRDSRRQVSNNTELENFEPISLSQPILAPSVDNVNISLPEQPQSNPFISPFPFGLNSSVNTSPVNTSSVQMPNLSTNEHILTVIVINTSNSGVLLIVVPNVTSNSTLGETDFQNVLNQLLLMHQPQSVPTFAAFLQELPVQKLMKEDVQQHIRCSICCQDFQEGNEVVQLPCKHVFEQECLSPWLKEHNSCPNCRFKLPSTEEDYEKFKREKLDQSELTGEPDSQQLSNALGNEESTAMEVEETRSSEVNNEEEFTLQQETQELLQDEPTIENTNGGFLHGLKRGFLNERTSEKKKSRTSV